MSRKHQQHAKSTQTNESAPANGDTSVEDRVRNRAYEIYLSREGGPGDALGDWLQAEREIGGETSASTDEARNG